MHEFNLDVHDVSCSNLVKADLQPVRFPIRYRGGTAAFLGFLEGERRPLEMRRKFGPVTVLQGRANGLLYCWYAV